MIKQKKGLGRGLNAIFTSSDTIAEPKNHLPNNDMAQVAIPNIKPNPNQPRREFDDDKLSELADSIRELGVIQPITLMREGESYTIISGERRWRAAQRAGLRTIPAYIREVDDLRLHAMALVENLQREDLNPMEISFGMQRLIDECGITQESLAQLVGMKRPTVANYLRLVKLSERVQLALKEDLITMGHAKALVGIEDLAKQVVVLDKVVELSLTVRQTEELARAMQQGDVDLLSTEDQSQQEDQSQEDGQNHPAEEDYPESYARLVEKLEGVFSDNISIKRGKKGGGRIVIEFDDDTEIESFISKLSNV
ncbi:MAG: ParB/RepB/Spo0J family partition protein [Rikenellaceae bacterium]